ncbi:MAG TPA: FAD-dependent oxidoreductase, partial [Gammaproteobacteria bacterium]|nr:FAD-dependent oxidoreductase [Gammaproteobacteria bacterium]
VGGGPTGSEIAANLHALGRRCGARPQVTLVTHGDRLIEQAPMAASRVLHSQLVRKVVEVQMQTRMVRREPDTLVTQGSRRIEAHIVVLATGL